MKTTITPEQKKFYDDNGFLAIEDFLDSAELLAWQTNTQDAVDQRLAADRGRLNAVFADSLTNQGNADDFYAQVFTQCIKLADSHAGMRKLLFAPDIGRMVCHLAGVDGIRVWHDQALFKMAYGNATAWHLDNPYWSFTSHHSISMWIALDDATPLNGCMSYVPGSHKSATFDNSGIGMNMGDLFKIYPEWKKIDPVAVPARAGTAVFHSGLTAHGAGANMTNKPRRAMTCAYMPDGSTYNGQQNVLPSEYIETLKVGDLLNDPVLNPLIWPVK